MRAAMADLLDVIPVLDLKAGQVVHARGGERAAYAPIQSPLAAGSAPLPLARALLQRSGGCSLYVADLDAITGAAAQVATLQALLQGLVPTWPGLQLWLDAGSARLADAQALQARVGPLGAHLRPVLGSESLAAGDPGLAGHPRAVLSLDMRHGEPLDPAGLWARPAAWPATVLVMTLDQVGRAQGPALDTLRRLRAQRPDLAWVGAGGIRHRGDLAAAAQAGASAWLVASALHDGSLQAMP
jgi:phosphoribosylformimino-5-aminoimidazole carboxamide ribotide isomerase